MPPTTRKTPPSTRACSSTRSRPSRPCRCCCACPMCWWLRLRRPSRACRTDRKSTRLNSSHLVISYAVFCLKKKKITIVLRTQSDCCTREWVPRGPFSLSRIDHVHYSESRTNELLRRDVCLRIFYHR